MLDTLVAPAGIRVAEASPEPVLVLRIWRPDETVRAKLAQQGWPTVPNGVTALDDQCSVAWVAPGEWVLIGRDAPAIVARATTLLDGTPHHLSDLSAATLRIGIEDPKARRLIAKACSLDLHSRVFGPGRCARSIFAQLPALLLCTAPDRFELQVDVSWRDYLLAWLRQAFQDLSS
jgi:sarcosine oxidase subunit gamma